MRLADSAGRFRMLAIDHRAPLQVALGHASGRAVDAIAFEEVAGVKRLITSTLAPQASAVLLDPIYGWPTSLDVIPGDVGLMVALEESGYPPAPEAGGRTTRLLSEWSVAKARRAGANGVKVLIPYTPDASEATRRQQQDLVGKIGDACAVHDLPFLLEFLVYPTGEESADTPEFAGLRPRLIIHSVREFSQRRYGVDILKVEFPGDLKYTREFAEGTFDGRRRTAIYDVETLRGYCRQLNEAAACPWVMLSGGTSIEEFLVGLDLAAGAGASGFLCGRAIWQEALPFYPNTTAMSRYLQTTGVEHFRRANAAAAHAQPWYEHPRIGGMAQVRLQGAGPEWYRRYGEE